MPRGMIFGLDHAFSAPLQYESRRRRFRWAKQAGARAEATFRHRRRPSFRRRTTCDARRRWAMDSTEGRAVDRSAHRQSCSALDRMAVYAATRLYLADAATTAPATCFRRRASRVQKKLGDALREVKAAHPADAVELWTRGRKRDLV